MENLDFWMTAGVITLGITGLMVVSLRSAKANAPEQNETPRDLQVYRDQLRDVERDIKRGTISTTDGERLKVEIARRLLDADKRATQAQAQAKSGIWLPVTLIVAAAAGAFALYNQLGNPGYPDLPLTQRLATADKNQATRLSQAQYLLTLPPAQPAQLQESLSDLLLELRKVVDPSTSSDLQGLEFLATYEAKAGNFDNAITAQNRLIALKADQKGANDYATLAELLIEQAQGYVSPEAEEALRQSLEINPNHELARYYLGSIFAQSGRFDRAFVVWRKLYEGSPDTAPWMPALRENLLRIAPLAGINYTPAELKTPIAGPSAQDMQNAQSLSDEERAAMIEGMVAQLSERLNTQGGTAEEWAQLIGALAVLGRAEQAGEIYKEAQTHFSGRLNELGLLEAAAQNAGIIAP